MGKIAIYKQAEDINNPEGKHYYSATYQEERFTEKTGIGRKEGNPKMKKGSINTQ